MIDLKQIAERLKGIREINNVSLHTLANSLKIDPKEYEEYETGKKDIPVGILHKIAEFFKVDLTEILTGESPKLKQFTLVRKGEGIKVERRASYKYQSLAYNFINKKAEPFLVEVNPTSSDKPVELNSHQGQEFNYVIEGKLLVSLNGHEVILGEGDSLYFDSSMPHGMKALDNKTAKFLAIVF